MRLTKSHSVLVAIGVLLGFFAIAFLFLDRSPEVAPSTTSRSSPTPNIASLLPTPGASGQFELTEFHRSEVKNGKVMWEVHGEKGRYSPQNSSAEIDSAHVILYGNKGEVSDLRSDVATVFLEGATLNKGHAKGNVVLVRNKEITLRTSEAIFDRRDNTVQAPSPVSIVSEHGEVTADRLDGNIETQEFVLSGNVTTTIQPGARAPEALNSTRKK